VAADRALRALCLQNTAAVFTVAFVAAVGAILLRTLGLGNTLALAAFVTARALGILGTRITFVLTAFLAAIVALDTLALRAALALAVFVADDRALRALCLHNNAAVFTLAFTAAVGAILL